jgi:tRNA (cmo5U34)-methyltransferase
VSIPAASAVFSAHAAEYTALRRRLVPGFDQFYGAALLGLRLPGVREITRVLDLGAGTGLLTAMLADAFPAARFELLDGSDAMLAEAQERLEGRVDAVHVGDMATGIPPGPFDAIVSALAIHHLDDHEKRSLFAAIHCGLAPGGAFVNAEQVLGPTPELDAAYQSQWVADCRNLGASEAEIAEARERRRHDRSADVESQLRWLREAGFGSADCIYKSWGFATLIAIKEG